MPEIALDRLPQASAEFVANYVRPLIPAPRSRRLRGRPRFAYEEYYVNVRLDLILRYVNSAFAMAALLEPVGENIMRAIWDRRYCEFGMPRRDGYWHENGGFIINSTVEPSFDTLTLRIFGVRE